MATTTAHLRTSSLLPRTAALLLAALANLAGACDEPIDDAQDDPQADDDAADNGEPLADDAADDHALARVWLHAFRRHLAGFPGGASDVERDFAAALAEQGLTDEQLRGYVARLESKLAEDLGEPEELPLNLSVTAALLAEHAAASAPLAAPPPPPQAGNCNNKPFDTAAKYRFKIEGVQTVGCVTDTDDAFPPCAKEEVFVQWTLFAPNTAPKNGLTNVETELGPFADYNKDVFNTGNTAPSTATSVTTDALLVFRLFEKDTNYYTNNALTDAAAASAAVKTHLDWNYIKSFGRMQGDMTALYESLSRASAGDDDVYPLQQLGGGEEKFWDITNGCYKYLGEFPFAIPDGDYFGYAMRSYAFSSHWRLWLTVNRI